MSDLDVLAPRALAKVTFGEGATAWTGDVRPLKLKQLPGFAAALAPIGEDIQRILNLGASVGGVLELVRDRFTDVIEALAIATGAPKAAVEEADIDQGLEAVLAVLQANRNFFKGRAATALQMAAVISGAGRTPSKPSSDPEAAGASPTSETSPSTN